MTDETLESADAGALLDYLKQHRAVDFTAYKQSTLLRRIGRRMQQVQIGSFGEYQDYLEVHPEEFSQLFDTILINVTSFFRDPEAWDVLGREIVPAILAAKGDAEPIRVWSAGCASGEEAFTLAMVWAERLGAEAFRQRVKIYATDIDESALAKARQATYEAKQMEAVPEELRGRYFEATGTGHTFRVDMRRSIVFGRHDLVNDAPISRLDLLVCRNTLIYFNAEVQRRILTRFHFAINAQGFLFLGKSEMLLTHPNLFQPVDLKHRIFSKTTQVGLQERLLLGQADDQDAAARLARSVEIGEEAFSAMPVAQIVIDSEGILTRANLLARRTFGLSAGDVGRPFQELEISYHPLELRSLIAKAQAERSPVVVPGVERTVPAGGIQHLDVQVTPLEDRDGRPLGASIVFEDTTKSRRMQSDLQRASQELETAYEELQSTNEELETTNEELQSTVEELETTNEELQSTNEEHETMNEELQSTNEELETMNEELRGRSLEIKRANALLGTILGSLGSGVVVVDRNLSVLIWNRKAEDQWGLRADETCGQSFANLDIGLPVGQLLDPLRGCLAGTPGGDDAVVDAIERRGRKVRCRVAFAPLRDGNDVNGAIMLIDEVG
jgi:two-component system, chemotaxis family, CheB/CheR fusion protein